MAMASTTSAAATMLLSGPMPSGDQLPYSQNLATLSALAPFPTVTLDLTNTNSSDPNPSPITHQPHLLFPGAPSINNSSQEFVNAAMAAIAADPNFSTALAAAISSIMGGAQPNNGGVEHHHSTSPENMRDDTK